MGKQIEKWADSFMFSSEEHNASEGPKVHLLAAGNDPLGQIAACAKMYMGQVVRDLADVTDDERRHYAEELKKTKLKMPLESFSMHFMLENVTRAFTHQMVRQRTAAYAQESMRFAVVEDMTEAVALPPSLAGTQSRDEWLMAAVAQGSDLEIRPEESKTSWDLRIIEFIERYASSEQKARFKWDETVSTIGQNYMALVDAGMPAEDARGLMPTNIVTRINYITNFRSLLDHSGNRLCTQAQFEWRLVFAQIAKALRDYGRSQTYRVRERVDRSDEGRGSYVNEAERPSAWQFDILADLLRPICYQTGSCQFQAGFDRKCSIRDRVQLNAQHNCPSSEWGEDHAASAPREPRNDAEAVLIPAIHPREWLADPAAAR